MLLLIITFHSYNSKNFANAKPSIQSYNQSKILST